MNIGLLLCMMMNLVVKVISSIQIQTLLNPLNDFSLLVPEDVSMVVDLTPTFTWNIPAETSQDVKLFQMFKCQMVNVAIKKKDTYGWAM